MLAFLQYPENFVEKTLSQFIPGDTYYVKKLEHGMDGALLCRFIKFEKGIVTGEVIDTQQWWEKYMGKVVTARPDKCYLWGNESKNKHMHAHCIWFDRKGVLRLYR